jgi:hypothetical protein
VAWDGVVGNSVCRRMVLDYSGTRGRIGWVYFVLAINVIPRVFVLRGFFLFFFVVFRLFFGAKVVLVTERFHLDACGVRFVVVRVGVDVGACLVTDSNSSCGCSLESDCNVSVALDVEALRGRRD